MGEHTLPEPAPLRPDMAILRVGMAVNGARKQRLTQEERDFFIDQAAILAWIGHLEKLKPEGEAT